MKTLKWHIGLTVIYATLFVLLLLIGLQFFITFVGQLGDIGKGDYGVWQALIYVVLTLPSSVYQFFPMAGLIGCLLGLGHLATHNELMIMRTSGVSVWQVVWSVLRAAIVLLILVTLIGELLGPSATGKAEAKKAIAKSGGQALSTGRSVWIRDGSTFIRIDSVASKSKLLGVNQYLFDSNNQLQEASFAKSVEYRHGKWWLYNVHETHLRPQSTTTSYFALKPWHVKVKPTLFGVTSDTPQEVSLWRLLQIIRYQKANGLQTQPYAVVFWQRVFQPLSTLVMILLGIPFIFGPFRSVSMGLRLVAGITISFMFYLINRFFGPFSLVYQIPPFLGAILPSCLFFGIGVWFMRRVR